MLWCSNCKYKFSANEIKSFNCGAKLSNISPPSLGERYSYLVTAKNKLDATLKISLLQSCGISAITSFIPEGTSFEVYTDKNGFGNDIFVKTSFLSVAEEIIKEQSLSGE